MNKTLAEMDDQELFIVLTDSQNVLLRAQLQHMIEQYLKFSGRTRFTGDETDIDLQTIVREYYEGKYEGAKDAQ